MNLAPQQSGEADVINYQSKDSIFTPFLEGQTNLIFEFFTSICQSTPLSMILIFFKLSPNLFDNHISNDSSCLLYTISNNLSFGLRSSTL
ncbi:hypothetical protein MHK_009853 [Candidatus Magnetomorum sp. HK-1]|nr:hypothetical protein MHK_009853 [Candidatus Magnetomorum sp. HK-1]